MGGLGPGYEQAIHVAMIEIVRDNLGKPLPGPGGVGLADWGYDTLRKDEFRGIGLSGAQAGAARNLAYRILSRGYEQTLDTMRAHDKERLIQVSKTWPRVPATNETR